jgi:hypothetical protein
MIFKLHGKKRYIAKRMKDEESHYGYHSNVCMQVVSTACLFEILVGHYFYTVLLEIGVNNKEIPKA